jgi:hypothetical protein
MIVKKWRFAKTTKDNTMARKLDWNAIAEVVLIVVATKTLVDITIELSKKQ